MLKKAAVVVGMAAATLLAVSPLALAGSGASNSADEVHETNALVNVSDNEVNTPVQACNNDFPINGGAGTVQGNAKDLTGAAAGALALFAPAEAENDVETDTSRLCKGENSSGGSVVQD